VWFFERWTTHVALPIATTTTTTTTTINNNNHLENATELALFHCSSKNISLCKYTTLNKTLSLSLSTTTTTTTTTTRCGAGDRDG
jgi:hypothetical protein